MRKLKGLYIDFIEKNKYNILLYGVDDLEDFHYYLCHQLIGDGMEIYMKNIVVPKGFKYLGKNIGIKQGKKDFAVAFCEKVCSSAAVFTKNSMCGVSIPIGRKNVQNGELQAIVVTSGIANVATGKQGTANALRIMNVLAEKLDIKEEDILPSSTGVIGQQLPIDTIIKGLNSIDVNEELKSDNLDQFVEAIMTTDTQKKISYKKVGEANILGVCKGSGMIEPNMATMLVYIFTDAVIDSECLQDIVKASADKTFNMMSIDTDTSTSDTLVAMASNHYNVNVDEFKDAFLDLCRELTIMVATDGEGASKLIEVNVTGAKSFIQAKTIAKSIVNSPLVKTSIYGADPNWGRVVMAIGKVADKDVVLEKVKIEYGGIQAYNCGEICDATEEIRKYLRECKKCIVNVDLGLGQECGTVWGCDLTEKYVEINGSYTS